MTITVVRGVVGRTEQLNHDNNHQVNQQLQSATQVAQSSAHAVRALSQDAVVSSVRPSRVSFAGDKVRDSREARELAENTAERIRSLDKDGGEEVHAGISGRATSASSLLK